MDKESIVVEFLGQCYVLPVEVVENYISGKISIGQIDKGELILRGIVKEWLDGINECQAYLEGLTDYEIIELDKQGVYH